LERWNDKKKGLERKKVGLVLVPGKDVVKCLLDDTSEPQPWVSRKRGPPVDVDLTEAAEEQTDGNKAQVTAESKAEVTEQENK
jgi:hypothetical protein